MWAFPPHTSPSPQSPALPCQILNFRCSRIVPQCPHSDSTAPPATSGPSHQQNGSRAPNSTPFPSPSTWLPAGKKNHRGGGAVNVDPSRISPQRPPRRSARCSYHFRLRGGHQAVAAMRTYTSLSREACTTRAMPIAYILSWPGKGLANRSSGNAPHLATAASGEGQMGRKTTTQGWQTSMDTAAQEATTK